MYMAFAGATKTSRKRCRASNDPVDGSTLLLTPQGGITRVNLTRSLKELTVDVSSPSRSSKAGKLKGRKLEFNDPPGAGGLMPTWTDQETESLVRFILMYSDGHALARS